MSKVKIDWGKEENLFPTKRISLWPSLFINENGRHYLSWYEYNSYYYKGWEVQEKSQTHTLSFL
jgi:hypothetical protein